MIGIASGKRVDAVRAAGAVHVIDRAAGNVSDAVRAYTEGRGVAAVFDPIGASTYETSLQLLAPRGCLINYGELSGPIPAINLHQLFPGSVFVTKYNGMHWVGWIPGVCGSHLGCTESGREAPGGDLRHRRALPVAWCG